MVFSLPPGLRCGSPLLTNSRGSSSTLMEHRKEASKPTVLQCLSPADPDFQPFFFASVFCCLFWFLVACGLLMVCRDSSNHHIGLSSRFDVASDIALAEATMQKTEEKLGQIETSSGFSGGGKVYVAFLKGFFGALWLLVPCVLMVVIVSKPRGRGTKSRLTAWPRQYTVGADPFLSLCLEVGNTRHSRERQ